MGKLSRRIISILIAVIMAVPMIAGFADVSYAASVSGVKAKNAGFRMVRISWSAVKIEIPQEPAEIEEPEDPSGGGDQGVSGATLDPENPTGSETPADPVTPADPENPANPEDLANPTDTTNPADTTSPEALADPTDPADPEADLSVTASVIDDPESLVESEEEEEPADFAEETSDSIDPTVPADSLEEEAPMAVAESGDDLLVAADAEENPVVTPQYEPITYKVYRATAKTGKYELIKTTKATSFTNKGLKIGKTYYYKVMAYRSNGKKYGTSAIVSVKVAKKITAKTTLLMKNNKAFNFRIEAKQKLYQYDTLQGACAHGGYAFLTLYNRKVECCKIVKVKLSTLSVVKVSKALPIYHGNNLTYNTKKKKIVATCCTTEKKAKNRVVLISPSTLEVVSVKDIKLTKKVKKLPKRVRKKNKGFTAIAYNEKHNCYVARLRQNDNVVILDKNLKPLRYVKLRGKKTWLLAQGIETVGNYIYDVRSFKGRYQYCMITVHTMSGKYVGQLKFPYGSAPGNELQCLFHNGRQYYVGCYYSTSQMDDTKKNHVLRVNTLYTLDNL